LPASSVYATVQPMRRLLLIPAGLVVAGIVAPAAVGNPGASIRSVDLAPSGQRVLSGSAGDQKFTLAGIHWRGPGQVLFRTRSLEGRWSMWRPAAPDHEDGPDEGSRELRLSAGWRIGNPWWVGPSDRIETRTFGRITRVRAHLVWSPDVRVPIRVPAATIAPAIVPRLSWGADEAIRRAPPSFADAVRFSVVHHTAGRNGYSRSEAAAIVKAIQLYHVKGNGWNDIGYNFLVDRFGTVYEGRFGGIERNVIGAHARGFNTGSVGIAVLGTYTGSVPSQAAQEAVANLVAWRLDLAHVDPAGLLTFISGGSERYGSGVPVLLRAVTGHRDTGFTECPGDAFYARLDALAAEAARTGLPKIYEPQFESGEGIFRFRARLSSSRPWLVRITDRAGAEVARGTGTGINVDWTWDSIGVPAGTYTWSIASGTARPATGPLRVAGGGAALTVQATATPAAITPNADGQADAAQLEYTLSASANVTVAVVDASEAVVATPVDRVWTRAGKHAVTIDGAPLADGLYDVVVTARTAAGVQVETTVALIVSRMLGLVSAVPAVFSPNGDGRNDLLAFGFSLTVPATVNVRIVREGRWVASPHSASYEPGAHSFSWNGVRAVGRLRDGAYTALVEAVDVAGVTVAAEVPFRSDTLAPSVRILPGRAIRAAVSEPGILHLRIDGARLQQEVRRAGVVRIRWEGAARRVRIVAEDVAGNRSKPVLRLRPPSDA
jgi:N-acetylmuramoyl-L-alanine amidase